MQFFGQSIVSKLTKSSSDIVSLPAGSVLRVGGRAANLTSALQLSRLVSGAGGLDSGSIANLTFYYVYLIWTGSAFALIASTSATSPTGYTSYSKVGAFYTSSTGTIVKTYYFGEVNKHTLAARISNAAAIVSQPTPSFVNGATNPGTGQYVIDYTLANLAVTPSFPGALPNSSAGRVHSYSSPSATSVQINIFTIAGAAVNDDFSFTLVKQGIDSVQPDWTV